MRVGLCIGLLLLGSAAAAAALPSSADNSRLLAAIVSRCGADNSCINRQMEALDRISAFPPGSPQMVLFKTCTAHVKMFEDIDWVQAETCVRKGLLTPPTPQP